MVSAWSMQQMAGDVGVQCSDHRPPPPRQDFFALKSTINRLTKYIVRLINFHLPKVGEIPQDGEERQGKERSQKSTHGSKTRKSCEKVRQEAKEQKGPR